jgi:hypothetical protein
MLTVPLITSRFSQPGPSCRIHFPHGPVVFIKFIHGGSCQSSRHCGPLGSPSCRFSLVARSAPIVSLALTRRTSPWHRSCEAGNPKGREEKTGCPWKRGLCVFRNTLTRTWHLLIRTTLLRLSCNRRKFLDPIPLSRSQTTTRLLLDRARFSLTG